MTENLIGKIEEYLEEQFLHDKKRLAHIHSVMQKALELGEIFRVSKDKITIASLLHDATKKLSFPENYSMARIIFAEETIKHSPKPCLHAYSATALAKIKFQIDDEEILNAIAYHCSGRKNMGILEKIIYIADYIEETRTFIIDEEIKHSSKVDLDRTVYLIMKETEHYLKEHNRPLAKDTLEAIEAYESKGGF